MVDIEFVEGKTYPNDKTNDENLDKWIPIENVIAVLKDNWQWIKNPSCKYVDLRIDTRDMHCVIFDRDHNLITLNQLRYQYEFGKGEQDERTKSKEGNQESS